MLIGRTVEVENFTFAVMFWAIVLLGEQDAAVLNDDNSGPCTSDSLTGGIGRGVGPAGIP